MKVFLDVGAHTGQTLAAVKRWDFDRIVCFEPAHENVGQLRKLADKRTEIRPYGLWNKNQDMPLYDAGSQGASLWPRPGRPVNSEVSAFLDASDWFRNNLEFGDTVWMKINVEGAEIDILNDLLDTHEFQRVDFLTVLWDAHKIPAVSAGLAKVQARLAEFKAPRVITLPPEKTHVARIDHWLTLTGAVERR